MPDLSGKVVVVTGASMGIGEAIARVFVREGASVALSSRSLERAEAARQRIGAAERTLAMVCDVTRREDLERLLATTLERFGRVDVWVNNAGFGLMSSIANMDLDECRRMFDTNFFAVIQAMQLVAPVMKRQGSGSIINISSVAGSIAVPYMSAYGASKHALNAITRGSRIELEKHGIHVLNVCPGYIATDFAENAVRGPDAMRLGVAARRGISADEVAEAVLRGYVERKREIVVPRRDHLYIKIYQLAPRLLEVVFRRLLRPADQVLEEAKKARES